jgi:hypothetical protein
MLSGTQWAVLEPLVDGCQPPGPGRRRTCDASSRRSGGNTTVPRGARSHKNWGAVVACGTDLRPRMGPRVVADQGYSSHRFRQRIA